MKQIFCRNCGEDRVVAGNDQAGYFCYKHFEEYKKQEDRLASGLSACHGVPLDKRFYCSKCWAKQDVDKIMKYEREKK